MLGRLKTLVAGLFALALMPSCGGAQQVPDSSFNTTIARPAFTTRHPRVAIDQAHHNFHTMDGRYYTFAMLAKNDGWDVVAGRDKFTAASLKPLDALVISNAIGHEDMGDSLATRPAFTAEEAEAVRAWVEGGGALLLIADHSPMGAANAGLGRLLGVDMRNSYAIDTLQASKDDAPSNIGYDLGKGLDADHPIVRGRDSTERVRRVVAFTGQSITGPPGSIALMKLSDRAEDLMVGLGEAGPDVPSDKRMPAAGRAQGVAFTLGKGRVVVLAEAAMMSAQVAGPRRQPMGMNVPGNDDRQFAINVMRWLGRAL